MLCVYKNPCIYILVGDIADTFTYALQLIKYLVYPAWIYLK